METLTLKIWKTHPSVNLPSHQTEQSACFDLAFQTGGKSTCSGYSQFNKPINRAMKDSLTISPGDRMMVPTGLVFDIPEGYSVRVHARSGMSLKQGLTLVNAEGVIDADYVQEAFVLIHNISGNPVTIKAGDRIAQAELVKNVEYKIEQISYMPMVKTSRIGGFGSTGITNQGQLISINTETVFNNNEIVKRGRGRPRKNA